MISIIYLKWTGSSGFWKLPLFLFLLLFSGRVLYSADLDNARKKEIVERYSRTIPKLWGEKIAGIKTGIDTEENVIALTFDACGSKTDGYDSALIEYLISEKIPATLFISGRWIDKYPGEFSALSQNSLFEIENHGLAHRPCSVNGRSAYGIRGTKNAGEVYDEIELNAQKMEKLTGRKPKVFRSGTANYDEAALEIIKDLGNEAVGFSINGDYGATSKSNEIKERLLRAPKGSIVIFHMNRPEKETRLGIEAAVPEMKKKGIRFVKLSDYKLK